MRILIADDEPAILMSLDFLMRKEGHQVFVARDGEEAILLIENELPEVIILDIMMPKIDGYGVCQQAKALKTTYQPAVVFISAKIAESDIEKGYAVGADLYIPKPFSNRELVKKINELYEKLKN
jgi:DNA-binding response OmpR family regulator